MKKSLKGDVGLQQLHSREEILSVMSSVDCTVVATTSGVDIRSRMMHYWNDENFNVYVATMKGDPKTLQITENPSVSVLILKREENINDSREIEITGRASFVKDKSEKDKAFQSLAQKSPVVKYLKDTDNLGLLDCIKIVPKQVKYRVFKEIVQGNPPTVLEFPENKEAMNEFQQLMTKLGHWRIELRSSFLTATLVSVVLGTTIAWARDGLFNQEYFLLTLAGALFLHLGTNVINDYFDYKSGNDEVNKEFVRPFSGGSRTIQHGLLTPLEVLSGALLFYILGITIGLYLTWSRGWVVLVLGAIGFISGFFYTSTFISWASLGVGEAFVGANFGALMTLGAYYVQTQMLSVEPLIASVPVSALITAVLYINEFLDYKADKAVGKNTLVVRWGRQKAAYGFIMLMMVTYGSLSLGVLAKILPVYTLIGFVTLPLAIKAVRHTLKHHSSPFDLVPANASTILCHLLASLSLSLGYFSEWLGLSNIGYIAFLSFSFILFTIYFYTRIEKQRKIFLGLRKK